MDEPTYKVAIGPALAGKIPPGDSYWPKFNSSFENMSIEAVTLAGYIYDGHAFTTWHKDKWRKSANYVAGQHIGIDFDTEDKRSTLPYLLADPFVARYASLIYTTPSHTEETPRARIVFLLDSPIQQAQNYVLAVRSLLWLFGNADRQCSDPVRFFYGGKPGDCNMEWLANQLPLAIVKDLIARYQKTGNQARQAMQRSIELSANQGEVAEALKRIPPWGIDYDEWLAVLMAIHSEWPGNDGLALADSWAAGYDGEVQRKWRSFHAEGGAAGRVSIATVFALAKRYGHAKV